jgi:hypothetical protein
VVNFLARKKLFRPETTASPRLQEQDEFFVDGAHDRSLQIGWMKTNPVPAKRQGKRETQQEH